MGLFWKLPPALSIPIFYALVSLGVILRLLLGTAIGTLALSVAIYRASPTWWGVEPYSGQELLFWFSDQSDELRVAVASAALTVAGFVVAFHTATMNWQHQLTAQLKTQSAGEIEEFFAAVVSLITDAEIYVQSLIDAVNKLQKSGDPVEARFAVDWAIEQSQKFLSTRSQISQAQVQVHRLMGRSYSVLSTGWGLSATFDQAIRALNKIGATMWIHTPIVDKRDPDYVQHFHNLVNVEECRSFVAAAKKYSGPLSMLAGSIKGYLLSPILGFNIPMYVGLVANRRRFTAAVRHFHRVMNEP